MDGVALVIVLLCSVGLVSGFLAIFLSRKRRPGKSKTGALGNVARPVSRSSTPPDTVAHTVQRPASVSPPVHKIGRIEIPRTGFGTRTAGNDGMYVGNPTGVPMCPYCLNPISQAELFVCPACKAAHHKACWESQKGCSMFSCIHAPAKSV
ncbi:MAG: hypothetical protein FJZ93_10585 [Chloroflexi bacterium]|nr:hypothetical protein [Chloroflexota bacterium]